MSSSNTSFYTTLHSLSSTKMASHESTPARLRGEQIYRALQNFWPLSRPSAPSTAQLPLTTPARLSSTSSQTILYLAYGSNLSAKTFKGMRGIQPLSAIPVQVPSLSLTFDLPGIPYKEPCFANTCYRSSSSPSSRWPHGLIGVVYEVTPADYRTIIATEGGGSSYLDITVPCHPLHSTPDNNSAPFLAHTLLCPQTDKARALRPDPTYAQPSPRYLKLITDGAEEHQLPASYLAYLYSLRAYRITTIRQRIGQVWFLGIWAPILALLLGLGKVLADDEGRIPGWLARLMEGVTWAMWAMYDGFFKRVFGDGERTLGDDYGDEEMGGEGKEGWAWSVLREKGIRLDDS